MQDDRAESLLHAHGSGTGIMLASNRDRDAGRWQLTGLDLRTVEAAMSIPCAS